MENKHITPKLKHVGKIFRKSIVHFLGNRPVDLAGTTAYFAVFSIAPILIIIIAVFGYLVGRSTVREKLLDEITLLIGQESTDLLQTAIDNYQIAEHSGIGSIVGIGLFVLFATTLFNVMQNSINYIWRVQVKSNLKASLVKLIIDRFLSFGVILSIGFVLLVSLVVDAGISFLGEVLQNNFSPRLLFVTKLMNVILTLGIIMSAFALIFRFLPDIYVKWKAAWFGAAFTAVLFTLGKILIGLLVSRSNYGVVYGAAGSIVILLMWVYYSSLIFYFGVQLTYEFSRFYNHEIRPSKYAVTFQIDKGERPA